MFEMVDFLRFFLEPGTAPRVLKLGRAINNVRTTGGKGSYSSVIENGGIVGRGG